MKNTAQTLKKILKIAVSIGLITFLLNRVGISKFIGTVTSANLVYLSAAFVLFIVGVVIRSYKWQLLLGVRSTKIKLPTLVSFYFISMFWRNFISTLGGEVVKIYSVSRISGKLVESFAAVFMERGTGLFALLVISVVALIFRSDLEASVRTLVIVLFIGYNAFLLILFSKFLFDKLVSVLRLFGLKRAIQKIKEIHNSLYLYKENKTCLMNALVISFAYQIISVVILVYVIAQSLALNVPLVYFFLFCPIIGVLEMLPISLNGLGIREGAFVFFFAKAGVSDVHSLSMSIIIYIMALLGSVIGGFLYAIKR